MEIKYKIIAAVMVVIVISGLIYYFVILPTINDIKSISSSVYLERLDLEKKYLRGQLLKKTMEDFEKIKPEKKRLSRIFVKKGQELEFITALEKISSNHGLEQSLKLGANQNLTNTYYPTRLEVSVKGEFIDFLKYLNNLEKFDYYYNIDSITISSDSQRGNTGDFVNSVIAGKIFVQPPAELPTK